MDSLFRSLITGLCALLLLASPLWAADRFMAHDDGTVTDTELMVMWARTDNQTDISYEDADKFARFAFGYTIATQYDNWRLPYVSELKSLYRAGKDRAPSPNECGKPVPVIPEVELSCGWVWAIRKATNQPVVFNFQYGSAFGHQSGDITGCRVLPVRDLIQ